MPRVRSLPGSHVARSTDRKPRRLCDSPQGQGSEAGHDLVERPPIDSFRVSSVPGEVEQPALALALADLLPHLWPPVRTPALRPELPERGRAGVREGLDLVC